MMADANPAMINNIQDLNAVHSAVANATLSAQRYKA